MINYIGNQKINRQKWDHCIKNSPVFLPYAFSWYLDIVAPGWDALIKGDYEYVMPLTGSRKTGFYYLFPPLYTQQLGVIPATDTNPFEIDDFIKAIPEKYKYISLFYNNANIISDTKLVTSLKYGTNFILNLNDAYVNIYKRYSENIKRNIKKAIKNEIVVVTNQISPEEWFEHKLKMLKEKKINVSIKYISRLKELIKAENEIKKNLFYTAYNHTHQIIAGVLFFIIGQTALLFSFTSKEGRDSRAFYLLLDKFIQEYVGKIKTLNFMGSNISGIAYTNEGFGGVPVTYPISEINRLPGWINYFRMKPVYKHIINLLMPW